MKLDRVRVVVYSKYTSTEGVATERGRERESTLTVFHSCHRARIPFGQVRIERRCITKHCKQRVPLRKERPTHHKQQKRYRFKNTKIKIAKTCENCDPIKLELSYIQNAEGEKECTHVVAYLSPRPYSIWTRQN
jgi:hypothetical protein